VKVRNRQLATLAFSVASAAAFFAGTGAASAAPPESCEGPAIRVLVNDQSTGDKVPLPDVAVAINDEAGVLVIEGVTDEKGVALLCLPDKATYTVVLDTATLPEGAALQDESNTKIVDEQTFTTNVKTVAFFTGTAVRETQGYFGRLIDVTVNGIRLGIIIAICSVGLSLIFGTTGLTNFAHGELVTFGGVVTHLLTVAWGIPFLIGAPVAVLLGGLLGLFLDWALWARLRKRGIGLISQMVVSVGLSIALVNFYLMRFGGFPRRFTAWNDQIASSFGPIDITQRDFVAGLVALTALVSVALMLRNSRLGKATRAVSDNSELASSTGIDSQKIIRIVWFLGGALAALGGVVRGLDEGVEADMGAGLLFLMFAGITLGGLGSAYGALVGGFVIGLFVEVSTMGIPVFPELPLLGFVKHGVPTELKTVPALAVLILILLFRPQGILGQKERVG